MKKKKQNRIFKRHMAVYESLESILFEDHHPIWSKLMVCKVRMDGVYFRMLCNFLYLYIIEGTKLNFSNPIMQATIEELRRMVDSSPFPQPFPHNGKGSSLRSKVGSDKGISIRFTSHRPGRFRRIEK